MGVVLGEWVCGPGVRLIDYACDSGPQERPFEEQHRSFCVAFVRSGGFGYRTRTGSKALGAGSVLLGNRGHPYTCSHHVPGGDRCLSFNYAPEVIDEVAGDVGRPPRFDQPALPPRAAWAALPALGESAVRAGGPSLEEVAYEVLARALSAGTEASAPAARPDGERKSLEAMRYIDSHAAEPLTLRKVAAQAGLTPFHFLRAFRRASGATPHQYLLGARVRRAAALLLDTGLPVTEVAYESGFGDLSNFIRTFRRAAGCSPRSFRQERRRLPAR
jgi:AraC-like DNA-binding protein